MSLVPRVLWTLALLLGLTAESGAPPTPQQGSEMTTIRWIARTLDRLGEKETAKRLITDYTQTGRVRFTDLGGDGVNAETGPSRRGGNEMDLDRSYLKIADLERLLVKRPYGSSSTLVSAAATIYHEYQHMDQNRPQNTPKYEDPAWQATDAALARWTAQLEREWATVKRQPPSAARTQKLQEIGDLVRQVLAEASGLQDGITRNEASGTLSRGLPWKIGSTIAKLRTLTAEIKKGVSGGGSLPAPTLNTADGWYLVEVVDYSQKPSDANYALAYGRGSIGWRWSLGEDVFGFRCTWSEPPKVIRVGDRIEIDISVSITENVGDYYSANGNFTIWFDRPDIEPGSAGSPIGFTNSKGETGGIDVSHRGAKTGASTGRRVYVDASSLPKAGRVALIVSAYNGRVAGTKYIYEWRSGR